MEARLATLILESGNLREYERATVPARPADTSLAPDFCADLVWRDECTGFELWLGSLEDSLALGALCDKTVNAVVNCAAEECRKECACFAPIGIARRSRSHARGASGLEAAHSSSAVHGDAADACRTLHIEQIKALAKFDAEWYSGMLGHDVGYVAIDAADEHGYRMDQHFDSIVRALTDYRQEGRRVLVHCVMGVNRSAAALVAFLCSGVGMSLEDAVALIAQKRGFVLSNVSFLEQLVQSFGNTAASTTEEEQTDRAEEKMDRLEDASDLATVVQPPELATNSGEDNSRLPTLLGRPATDASALSSSCKKKVLSSAARKTGGVRRRILADSLARAGRRTKRWAMSSQKQWLATFA